MIAFSREVDRLSESRTQIEQELKTMKATVRSLQIRSAAFEAKVRGDDAREMLDECCELVLTSFMGWATRAKNIRMRHTPYERKSPTAALHRPRRAIPLPGGLI